MIRYLVWYIYVYMQKYSVIVHALGRKLLFFYWAVTKHTMNICIYVYTEVNVEYISDIKVDKFAGMKTSRIKF